MLCTLYFYRRTKRSFIVIALRATLARDMLAWLSSLSPVHEVHHRLAIARTVHPDGPAWLSKI